MPESYALEEKVVCVEVPCAKQNCSARTKVHLVVAIDSGSAFAGESPLSGAYTFSPSSGVLCGNNHLMENRGQNCVDLGEDSNWYLVE